MWGRVPVILRAVFLGFVVSLIGTTPWAVLVALNARHLTALPWAVLPTAAYLWLFWRYVRGEGWPRAAAESRRAHCRANSLSAEVWGAAILAGIIGLAALVAFMRVFSRLSGSPVEGIGEVPQVSGITLLGWIVMSALVAGFSEEAGFRGYMQGPLERRYGPSVAILATGVAFGIAHLSHPQVTLMLMPYYLAVAAVYGALAYLTNSILPGIVLHAGGNMLSALTIFQQATPPARPVVAAANQSIFRSGPDPRFWVSLVVLIALTAAAVGAYHALARVVRQERLAAASVP